MAVDAGPQSATLPFGRDRLGLVEGDRDLAGGNDRRSAAQNIHAHLLDVALPLFVDAQQRHNHFLQGRPAVHVAAAGALLAQAVDGFGDENFTFAVKADIAGRKHLDALIRPQPGADHKATVALLNIVAAHLYAAEVALLQGTVLVDKAVVGGEQHVGDVGVGQLFDDVDQLFQRGFDGLEDPLFGVPFIAGGVDPVMVDVDHLMIAEQGPAFAFGHGQQLVGLHGRSVTGYLLRQNFGAILGASAALGVNQDGFVFEGQAGVGQQGSHAQLGVAGQHG